MANILNMKGITKYIFDSYGVALRNTTVKILDKVDFELCQGEVHILVGENGAGKSTLMKVLGGIIPMDEGEILLDGKRVCPRNPKDAQALGIGFIHQELNLCSNLSVAENIFMGRERISHGLKDTKRMNCESAQMLQELGLTIDPKTLIRELSTAQQQLVEIVKVLSDKCRIIIMDEPTSSLTNKEIDILFSLIRKLKKEGVSIIYISHRFEEFAQIGDRLSVLRDGKYIGTLHMDDFCNDTVIKMMVGRTLGEMYTCTHSVQDEVVLNVKGLKLEAHTKPIDLNVKKGEIVGLGGLVGAGRTEFAQSIFGCRSFCGGEIWYNGKQIKHPNPSMLIRKGFVYLTEDRKKEGLVLDMSIKENLSLASLFTLFKHFFTYEKPERQLAQNMKERLNIVSKSVDQLVRTLSGGNQQKVVLGKCLATNPQLLILDEPTRGIDVNAKAEIYKLIDKIASQGVAVLMISSDMPELIGMSDRIYVMRDGTAVAQIAQKQLMIQERIMEFTLGKQNAKSC